MRTLLVLASCLLVAYALHSTYQRRWAEQFIPAEIELEGVVSVAFDDTCRATAYSIAPESLNRIRRDWKGFLSTARHGRRSKEHEAYAEWRETPYHETGDGMSHVDRWLTARCSLDADLEGKLRKAVQAPGSYFSTSADSGLLVLPSVGIVLYSRVHF